MLEVTITPEQADMVLEKYRAMQKDSDQLGQVLSAYAYSRRDLHSMISVLLGGIEFGNVELAGTTLFVEVLDATDVQPLESGEEK